ncbi:DUF7674 family protein [Agrobacterium tumefaciens]|uniref:DUF7674 domain-containing protein n=1 Tax=Agrobacterium tumefaciens TaxID=358 RepID=A0A4D7YTX8_AGRTU|nr:hypothetical protein [Agrobacterium tumefaciens]QCL93890.1 hypothetical protein CFBP7129_06545 [Agrobacterium tumefaciens]
MRRISINFTTVLAERFEALKAVFSEHLHDNSGEILPHILVSDYLRRAQQCKNEQWVARFFAALETNFSGDYDDELSELLSVSVLEHIDPLNASDRELIQFLGTRMREEHRRIFGR